MSTLALPLSLVLLAAPEAKAAPPASPEASEGDQSAWDAAGWSDEGAPEAAPPAEGEASEAPGAVEAPGAEPAPEAPPSKPEDAEDGWDAAGWGDEEDEEDEEDEPATGLAPVEGPAAPGPGGEGGEGEEAWSEWDSEAGTSDESQAEEFERPSSKVKVGDVLAGSLRLTGSFLHFDDEPLLYPDGDDALVLTVGRILVEADVGEHLHFSFNGFGELSRVPLGASAGGSFASAGSTASSYRTRYLAWQFWDDGSAGGQIGVERMSMRLDFDPVNVEIGRFPITYTVAGGLTTNDFFAPFSATAVNTIYKPGVDAIRVSTGIGAVSSVDVVGVLGYNAACQPDALLDPCEDPSDPNYKPDIPTWARSAVFARAATVGAGFEWAVLGGKLSERWVAGGSLQGDLGPINLRAEFHVGIPDEDGDGHDPHDPDDPDSDKPIYGRASGGPAVMFGWQNATISAEYMFASDGASSALGYFTLVGKGYTDDLPYLGQHYISAGYGMELIPILRLGLNAIVNATDGSGLAGISLIYNVADESDLILGVFVPWGKGVRNLDPTAGPLDIGSEFGLAPLSAYLEARVFF